MNYIFKVLLAISCLTTPLDSLCTNPSVKHMKLPLLERVIVSGNRVEYVANRLFAREYLQTNFFVEYDDVVDLASLNRSLLIVPFLLNVIPIVWLSDQTYYVQEMDRQLFESLKVVKKLYQALYPRLSFDGQVIPKMLTDNVRRCADGGTLVCFSGGLDSLCACYDLEKETLGLFTVFEPLFGDRRIEKIRSVTHQFGQKFGYVNNYARCNYNSFFKKGVIGRKYPQVRRWREDAVEGLGWIGIALPIMIQRGYSKLVISSSTSWEYPYVYAGLAVVDEVVKCAGISVRQHAFDENRSDKNRKIKEYFDRDANKVTTISTCLNGESVTNCCHCSVCYVTIFGCCAVGMDPQSCGFTLPLSGVCDGFRKGVESGTIELRRLLVWRLLNCKKEIERTERNGDKCTFPSQEFQDWFTSLPLEQWHENYIRKELLVDWQSLKFCSAYLTPQRMQEWRVYEARCKN